MFVIRERLYDHPVQLVLMEFLFYTQQRGHYVLYVCTISALAPANMRKVATISEPATG